MKTILFSAFVLLLGFASSAFAAAEADGGGSMLLFLFLGFFALIIVFQLVPAVILFYGMLKGLFAKDESAERTQH